jgi:hypothetical protein
LGRDGKSRDANIIAALAGRMGFLAAMAAFERCMVPLSKIA